MFKGRHIDFLTPKKRRFCFKHENLGEDKRFWQAVKSFEMLNNFTRILQKNFWKNQKNEKNKGAALWPKNQYFRDISAGLSPSAEMVNFLNNKSYVIYKNMRFSDHVNLKNKKSKKAGYAYGSRTNFLLRFF